MELMICGTGTHSNSPSHPAQCSSNLIGLGYGPWHFPLMYDTVEEWSHSCLSASVIHVSTAVPLVCRLSVCMEVQEMCRASAWKDGPVMPKCVSRSITVSRKMEETAAPTPTVSTSDQDRWSRSCTPSFFVFYWSLSLALSFLGLSLPHTHSFSLC